jgi:hypothetical protein
MKTLFLQAPSFVGFDGGAGSRFQTKREIQSLWYPTWLAHLAALIENSRVLDAQADGLSLEASLSMLNSTTSLSFIRVRRRFQATSNSQSI